MAKFFSLRNSAFFNTIGHERSFNPYSEPRLTVTNRVVEKEGRSQGPNELLGDTLVFRIESTTETRLSGL